MHSLPDIAIRLVNEWASDRWPQLGEECVAPVKAGRDLGSRSIFRNTPPTINLRPDLPGVCLRTRLVWGLRTLDCLAR